MPFDDIHKSVDCVLNFTRLDGANFITGDLDMKNRPVCCVVGILSVLVFVLVAGAVAQNRRSVRFSGLINDYSPSSVKGGPWEMHGTWSLEVNEEWGNADFSAALTMSDYGTSGGLVDPTKPGQNPHTHHIKLTNATVTQDMTGCPTFSPAVKTGFQVNGTVTLMTGNGSNAPFETDPPSSTLQVCITGGDDVPYSVQNSNVTLVFEGPAVSHFGSQAIHGVVRKAEPPTQEHW